MHELAITQSVLDIALEHARNSNANKIARINLVGEMTGIVDAGAPVVRNMTSR